MDCEDLRTHNLHCVILRVIEYVIAVWRADWDTRAQGSCGKSAGGSLPLCWGPGP